MGWAREVGWGWWDKMRSGEVGCSEVRWDGWSTSGKGGGWCVVEWDGVG